MLSKIRALGKKQVNTAEIARGLGLSVSTVGRVLPKLIEREIQLAG